MNKANSLPEQQYKKDLATYSKILEKNINNLVQDIVDRKLYNKEKSKTKKNNTRGNVPGRIFGILSAEEHDEKIDLLHYELFWKNKA